MPITGDAFNPLSVGMHRRTAQRFIQDIALPEWVSSVSRDAWMGTTLEDVKLDETEALTGSLFVPPTDIKGVRWRADGARYHLYYGVLTFVKYNRVYVLIQSAANYYTSGNQEFLDPKQSLQELYRSITFNSGSNQAAASTTQAPGIETRRGFVREGRTAARIHWDRPSLTLHED